MVGIFLISLSLIIYGLKQFLSRDSSIKGFSLAIITGCFIASYSIVDGYGARVTQNPIGFYSTMTLINGLIFYFYAKWKDRDIIKRIFISGKRSFFIGGTASYAAYGIVVWACLFLPIAVVSSIRETSILLGLFFLKEKINLIKSFLIVGLFFGLFFLELDKQYKKYNFDNAPQFFNEELPYPEEFIAAFKVFCKSYSLPIKVTQENQARILNSIKAFIALQRFNENMYIRIINQTDPFILRALEEVTKS